MKFRNEFLVWLVLVSFTFSLTGCGGGDGGDSASPVAPTTGSTFSLDKTTAAAPYEVLTLSVNNVTLSQASYTAMIGGKSTDLIAVNQKLAFMVPDLPAGQQTLTATIEGQSINIPMTVKAAPSSSAQTVTNQFASTKQLIQTMAANASSTDQAFFSSLQTYVDELNTKFQALSTSDQLWVAGFIAANANDQGVLSRIALRGLSTPGSRISPNVVDDLIGQLQTDADTLLALLVTVNTHLARAVYFMVLTAAGLTLGVTVVGAVATGIALGLTFVQLQIYWRESDEVADRLGKFTKRIPDVFAKIQAFSSSLFSSVRAQGAQQTLIFENGKEASLTLQTKFSNLNVSHRSSNYPLVQQIIKDFDEMKSGFTGKVHSALPGFAVAPKTVDDYPALDAVTQMVPAKYFSFVDSSISNSKVKKGSFKTEGNNVTLSFSTTESVTQNFTFELNYKIPGLFDVNQKFNGRISFGAKQLVRIEVPTMVSVIVGKTLDLGGVKIKATYSDGTTTDLTDYTNVKWELGSGDGTVSGFLYTAPTTMPTDTGKGAILKCTYTENGVTAVSNLIISLEATAKKLTDITLSPTSATVQTGGTYNLAEKVTVTAQYDDSTTAKVTGTWLGTGVSGTTFTAPTTAGTVTLTCSYTEGEVTKTPTFSVTMTAQTGARFTRDADGIITDSVKNLQWKEGPDQAMSWNEAQTWINGLGNNWTTPTRVQLKDIYIADSTRQGGKYVTEGPWALHLDPAFQLDKAYDVWAESRDSSSAWHFAFYDGIEYWDDRATSDWSTRAFAVRSR